MAKAKKPKPELSDGFLRLAYELWAALMVRKLSGEARIVLCEVLLQVYGRARRTRARIKPSDLARRTGLRDNNITRGATELVRQNILVKHEDGSYSFNKYHDTWNPAWDGRMEAYCVYAPTMANAYFHEDRAIEDERPEAIKSDSSDSCLPISSDSSTLSDPIVFPINSDRPPLEPPYKERRQEREEDVDDAGGGGGPLSGSGPADLARPFAVAPADLRRVADWAEALSPLEGLGARVETFATSYPLAWIEAALLCGLASARPGKVWPYANRCLLAWYGKGRPDFVEVAEAREKATAAPPAPPHGRKPRAVEATVAAWDGLMTDIFGGHA